MVDAQDLKSCVPKRRAGPTPAPGTVTRRLAHLPAGRQGCLSSILQQQFTGVESCKILIDFIG